MARNSTAQPAARSSGLAFSISLWLMPFSQGTKIIPAGPSSARKIASWPAPLTMSICGMPSACAASRTAPTHPWSKYSGGKSAVGTSSYCKPCFSQVAAITWRTSAIIESRRSGCRWRKSRVIFTSPGITLREPG